MDKALEMAKEIERVYRDTLDYKTAYRQVVEQYKKAQSQATTQGKEHIKTFNDIIPSGADIDNGDIYNLETGATIRRIEDESI